MPSGFVYKKTPPKAWVHGQGKATVRFGAVPLMPGGHGWQEYVPKYELQNINGVESYSCTVYASLKAWITLANKLGLPFPKDCSERFNAILANITPPGANPYDVGESIRQWGVIHNDLLPFDDTIKSTYEFFQPKPMDEGLIAEAKKILQKVEPGHEYLWNDSRFRAPTPNKPDILKRNLERGPICVSVHGWKKNDKGLYYKDKADDDNHWTMLEDYKEGEYWIINDQYKPFIKKVAWDTDFQTAQLYFLKENTSGIAPNDLNYFLKILKQMSEMVRLLALKLQK